MRGKTLGANSAKASHMWLGLFFLLVMAMFGAVETAVTPPIVQTAIQFNPPGGYYEHGFQLKIEESQPGADIRYTLDGSLPTPENAPRYTQPIQFNETVPGVTVVRARAYEPNSGDALGPTVTATYVLGLDAALPILSIAIDPADFTGPEAGIYTNFSERGVEWERPVTVAYIAGSRQDGFQTEAGIRIHGNWTRRFFQKKSFRLYFRQEYGAKKLEYPLFDSGGTTFKRLVLFNSGLDLVLIRNQLMAQLVFAQDGYASRSQPVLLFINGQSWGIYQIRERINSAFLAQNYGIETADFLDAPDNEAQQAVIAGDRLHWELFTEFIAAHDLADPEYFAYIQTQVNLPNFVDYLILQLYAADTDWPEFNIHQFRPRVQGGRWHWLFWDNDFSFQEVDKRTFGELLTSEKHDNNYTVQLLRKLLQNESFRNLFLTCTADLLNGGLSPTIVSAQIDELASQITPDIAYEAERWAIEGSWPDNIQKLHTFAQQRPDVMRQDIVEALNLPGVAHVTFAAGRNGPELAGQIVVNGQDSQPLPWSGIYFQDSMIEVEVIPPPGYAFVGWVDGDGGETAVTTIPITSDQTFTPQFAPLSPE